MTAPDPDVPAPTTPADPSPAPTAAPIPAAAPAGAPAGAAAGAAAEFQGPPPLPGDAGASGRDQAGAGDGDGDGAGRKRRRRRRRGKKREDGDAAPAGDAATVDGAAAGTGGADASARDGRRPARVRRERGERSERPERPRRAEHPSHGPHGPHGPHGRRGKPVKSAHHALDAMRALSQMAQALLKIEGVDPLSVPRYLDLNLRVPLDENVDARAAAGQAVEQLLQRVREVREHERALRPGAVFCYFSGSAEVEHSRPAEPRQVFEGYNSTGRPVFSDFVTMAIERKDAGIDQLLGGEDVVLTHVTMGRVLRTQQLAEFGGDSPVFKILGQVDAGLFRVLGAEQKCAFSFQLLRGTTLEGKPRLRLHSVGKVDLMDLADPHVLNILSRFQRRLDTESLRLQGKESNGEVDDEAFVLPLLQDLAQKLAGRARSAGRRTQHAQARSDERQRPTPKAYPDAGEAPDGSILWDTEKSTIVVSGPKGRVHVFTPQARHVTSVMMQGSAVERRRQQGRWRLAEPEERGEFRIRLRQLIAAGEAETAADPDAPPEV